MGYVSEINCKWVKSINFTEDFNNNYDGNSSIAVALTILNN